MEKLITILEETLEKTGSLELMKMGEESHRLSKEDKEILISQLKDHMTIIDKIIIAIVILHFLIFLLAVFLVLYYRDNIYAITTLLGGSVLSLMVIVRSLTNLVKIRSKIAYILITLPNLSPEQAVILIESIYLDEKEGQKSLS